MMKNLKKIVVLVTVLGVTGAATAAFAMDEKSPGEILAALTGKSVADVYKEKSQGKTFGSMAKEAGKLDAFHAQMLEQKKAVLDERVRTGALTQAKADEIFNAIKSNQTSCDGTGNAQIGKKYGLGFGQGKNQGMGMGAGQGKGKGQGMGAGMH